MITLILKQIKKNQIQQTKQSFIKQLWLAKTTNRGVE